MTSAEPTPVAPTPGSSSTSAPTGAGSAPADGGAGTSAPADNAPLTKDEGAALQLALGTENAAIWAYALVAANDVDDTDTVAAMRAAHLMARDAAASRLIAGGVTPKAPAPAYATPKVTDVATARKLAISIEDDCAAAWHSVVGRTDRAELRAFAAAALAEAAVRTVQWKQLAKVAKPTEPFPGESG
ncbi:DUF4439 domain-containing protein [Nakamurella lactea]|jgi:hypothetical protein|uniref:DUF4439 domain-containing protein n=1 Tax=Nakamurella lactea TaxID=459515 RepID=UPI000416FFF7|nr:DUF4439 domain-containing protein [Nakamurella lactea]